MIIASYDYANLLSKLYPKVLLQFKNVIFKGLHMSILNIAIQDATLQGKVLSNTIVTLPTRSVTARQLIESRIRLEVERYNNSKRIERFNGLVQPTPLESELNGYTAHYPKRQIDADLQCVRALDAFSRNGFFLLVDDKQITELDAHVELSEVSMVQFVKLIPLVGG